MRSIKVVVMAGPPARQLCPAWRACQIRRRWRWGQRQRSRQPWGPARGLVFSPPPDRRSCMLSLQFIRDNPDAVREAAAAKNAPLDLDALLALDGETRALKTRIDELRR